ncbi:NTP/NDP exchange transporter [Haliangium sp.]|uniref:NTP/NDP exchange transporter n=1 Tax=Haliangium sp. TaxID=2663208 RepID=UPI003D13C9C9
MTSSSPRSAAPRPRLVDVRPDERTALVWAFVYFACLLGGYYILRPVREALAVAGGVSNLPWLFTGTLVGMLAVTPVFGAVVARMPRRRFVPLVYRFFLLCILGFAALLALDVDRVVLAPAYFIWLSVYNLFVVSVFWSVMADVFRSAQGKRLFGVIAAGGSLGALLGSWFTNAFATDLGVTALLCISALVLELAVRCFRAVTGNAPALAEDEGSTVDAGADAATEASLRRAAEPPVIGGSVLAGATQVVRSPYLLGICLYLVCLSTASTFLYVERAEIVATAFVSDEARTAFFAMVDLLVNLGTILLQLLVTARVIGWLGVGATLAVLPVLSGVGFAGLAAWPTLAALVVFQAALRAGRYAIGRPARELLFTVVNREQKYKCKSFIDTVVYRAGDAVSSWVVRGLGALGLGLAGVALVAAPLAGLWLLVGLRLGREQEHRSQPRDRA